MKKQLNVTSMVNELTGQSAFFKGAIPQPIKAASERNPAVVRPYEGHVRTDDSTSVRPNARTDEGNPKVSRDRPIKRHPFEIYRDQLDKLQQLKARALLEGENLSMSQIVREAIDRYLQDR